MNTPNLPLVDADRFRQLLRQRRRRDNPELHEILRNIPRLVTDDEDHQQECYLLLDRIVPKLDPDQDPFNYAYTTCKRHLLKLQQADARFRRLPIDSVTKPVPIPARPPTPRAATVAQAVKRMDRTLSRLLKQLKQLRQDGEHETADRLVLAVRVVHELRGKVAGESRTLPRWLLAGPGD